MSHAVHETYDAPRLVVTTAPTPGAIAMLQLHGRGCADVLHRLTGTDRWPAARMRLVPFDNIDEGVAVLLRDDWAQLMPHGGPRVVQKLVDRLLELGVLLDREPPARALYPEASSDLEADMLATIARAASSRAIDLLLAQPRLWLNHVTANTRRAPHGNGVPLHTNNPTGQGEDTPAHRPERVEAILERTRRWSRLIDPPSVVVVGRPNVGKSTLANRMIGRSASVVADLPGTTRDWVAGLVELSGVAVRWLDTPGLRRSDDAIEQRAIELARQVVTSADVLVALRDPQIDWPDDESLPRRPELWVMNKIDDAGTPDATPDAGTRDAPLRISAATGAGIDALRDAVLDNLGFHAAHETAALWAFSETLRRLLESRDTAALRRYIGCD